MKLTSGQPERLDMKNSNCFCCIGIAQKREKSDFIPLSHIHLTDGGASGQTFPATKNIYFSARSGFAGKKINAGYVT
jgi:hypothetical protein